MTDPTVGPLHTALLFCYFSSFIIFYVLRDWEPNETISCLKNLEFQSVTQAMRTISAKLNSHTIK
jgi:hypothetical protein